MRETSLPAYAPDEPANAVGVPRARWFTALGFAVFAALYAGGRNLRNPSFPSDFDQLWYAAHALLDARDPYLVVGPGLTFDWTWPLYYPLPAVVLSVPFIWMPVEFARVAFTTIAAGVLGWAIGARVAFLWPLLMSASFLISVSRTQWSPVILASMWVPALAFVMPAKPNLGLTALAAHDRRKPLLIAISLCGLILALSFLVRPDWLSSWRIALAEAPHVTAPILRPFGFLLLLAALKWRQRDARVFLLMSCIPHTPSLYDLLLFFFLCRSLREALGLAALLHALFWGIIIFSSWPTFEAYYEGLGRAEVVVVFLPVLARLLLRSDDAAIKESLTWREAVPSHAFDVFLSCAVLIGAFFLIWIPIGSPR